MTLFLEEADTEFKKNSPHFYEEHNFLLLPCPDEYTREFMMNVCFLKQQQKEQQASTRVLL